MFGKAIGSSSKGLIREIFKFCYVDYCDLNSNPLGIEIGIRPDGCDPAIQVSQGSPCIGCRHEVEMHGDELMLGIQ